MFSSRNAHGITNAARLTVADALKLIASSESKRKHQERSFWQQLEEEIMGKLKSPQPVS